MDELTYIQAGGQICELHVVTYVCLAPWASLSMLYITLHQPVHKYVCLYVQIHMYAFLCVYWCVWMYMRVRETAHGFSLNQTSISSVMFFHAGKPFVLLNQIHSKFTHHWFHRFSLLWMSTEANPLPYLLRSLISLMSMIPAGVGGK